MKLKKIMKNNNINDKNKRVLYIWLWIVHTIWLVIIIYIIFFSWLFIKNNNLINDNLINKNNIIDNSNTNIIWTLDFNDFKNKINNDYILIDLRTKSEVVTWFIEWTDLFIDYYSPNFKFDLISLDKNKKYLIYCAHWRRSSDTLNYMKKMNFKEVYDLRWWIVNWVNNWWNLVLKK